MTVEFECHHCGRELKADERAIGRKVRCPDCETLLIIPELPKEVPQAEEVKRPDSVESAMAVEEEKQAEKRSDFQRPHPTSRSKEEGTSEAVPAGHSAAVKPVEKRRKSKKPQLRADVTPPPIEPPVLAKAPAQRAHEPPLVLPRQEQPEDLIDMTAMVDIVFFLLIFFMVTSLQALEAVMNMPTPQSAEGGASASRSISDLENDKSYITVRIEDDDSIWVEDTQVFNDQELALKLRTARKEADGPRGLLVIGDADASHGSAVRVFDAGAGAGVNSISLIVQEKDESGR